MNCLALNPHKTELLWLATPRKRYLISHALFRIDGEHIPPSSEMRLLGVHFDASLAFDDFDASLAFNGHISNMSRTLGPSTISFSGSGISAVTYQPQRQLS